MRRRPDPTITPPSVFRRRDALAEAFAVIAQRPVRTLLTALGTILGVGAFGVVRLVRHQSAELGVASSQAREGNASDVRFDAAGNYTGTYGKISAAFPARQIQFALKLVF